MNFLRNVAVDEVSTKYVFLLDGDFVPCVDIETNLNTYMSQLKHHQVRTALLTVIFLNQPLSVLLLS